MAILNGTSGNDSISGTASADTISGLAGHDSLYGLAGDDILDGGAGNDFLNGGLGADILIGGSGYNDLNGAGGNDIYRMSTRIDALFSDDLVYDMVDGDLVDLSAWGVSDFSQVKAMLGHNIYGAAMDAYYNGVHHVLSFLNVAAWQFEADDFIYNTGPGGTQTGTASQDVLFGSAFADTLIGGGSHDRLLGGGGADTLRGGGGDDDLIGGAGRDTLKGGPGADWFIFDNASDSGLGVSRDVITDFVSGVDKIYLCGIDAHVGKAGDQAFTWRGSEGFTGAGQLRYAVVDGNTIIYGSTDVDTTAEFQIQLDGIHALTASDFFL